MSNEESNLRLGYSPDGKAGILQGAVWHAAEEAKLDQLKPLVAECKDGALLEALAAGDSRKGLHEAVRERLQEFVDAALDADGDDDDEEAEAATEPESDEGDADPEDEADEATAEPQSDEGDADPEDEADEATAEPQSDDKSGPATGVNVRILRSFGVDDGRSFVAGTSVPADTLLLEICRSAGSFAVLE